MMPLKKNLPTQNEQQNDQFDKVLKTLRCEGLGPHNKSLELILSLLHDLDATIDIGGSNRSYDAESFAIFLRGTSGNRYRISVNYRARMAQLIAKRFNEIDFESDEKHFVRKTIGALMHPFRKFMNFEIHWYDSRDGDWESICIHGRHDATPKSWPADLLATTMLILSDDLHHSLEPSMNTLRHDLRNSYPIAWCAGHTSDDVTFAYVTKFVTHLEALQNAGDREEFSDLRKVAREDLFNEKGQVRTAENLDGGEK
jgi:hypothetical protein